MVQAQCLLAVYHDQLTALEVCYAHKNCPSVLTVSKYRPFHFVQGQMYANLRETLIGQVGSTTKFLASLGDFPFPDIVRDLDYSDGVTCKMILHPSKEILI